MNAIALFKENVRRFPERMAIADVRFGTLSFSDIEILARKTQSLAKRFRLTEKDGVLVALTPSPVLYGLILGVHVLPGVIAQVLLRMPWVALISHVLAALVASAFVPPWIGRYIGTAILIGGLQELIAAIGRYRHWERWRYFVSAVIVGVVLAVPIALVADLGRFAPWAQVVYIAMFIVGPVAWTAVAVAIGEALRRAGVGRTARRR